MGLSSFLRLKFRGLLGWICQGIPPKPVPFEKLEHEKNIGTPLKSAGQIMSNLCTY